MSSTPPSSSSMPGTQEELAPWVVVSGSGDATPEQARFASALGEALADSAFGLRTGGWPGVDHEAGRGFLHGRGSAERLVHAVFANTKPPLSEGILLPIDQYSELVAGASALLLIGGLGGTKDVYEAAKAAGVPVLPLQATGGDAAQAWKELMQEARSGRSTRPDTEDLAALVAHSPALVAARTVAILEKWYPAAVLPPLALRLEPSDTRFLSKLNPRTGMLTTGVLMTALAASAKNGQGGRSARFLLERIGSQDPEAPLAPEYDDPGADGSGSGASLLAVRTLRRAKGIGLRAGRESLRPRELVTALLQGPPESGVWKLLHPHDRSEVLRAFKEHLSHDADGPFWVAALEDPVEPLLPVSSDDPPPAWQDLGEPARECLRIAEAERRRDGVPAVTARHVVSGLWGIPGSTLEGLLKGQSLLGGFLGPGEDAADLEQYPALSAECVGLFSEATDLAWRSGERTLGIDRLLEQILDRRTLPLVRGLERLGIDKQRVALEGGTKAGYRADVAHGVDLLGISRDVTILCNVLASKQLRPPMSVGLFGDWGSGKSFFIQEMKKTIRRLGTHAQQAPESPYCSYVAQIEFNAWHYVDTNIWASLTSHVFTELGAQIAAFTKKEVDQKSRILAASSKSAELLERARAERDEASRALDDLLRKKSNDESALQDSLLREHRLTNEKEALESQASTVGTSSVLRAAVRQPELQELARKYGLDFPELYELDASFRSLRLSLRRAAGPSLVVGSCVLAAVLALPRLEPGIQDLSPWLAPGAALLTGIIQASSSVAPALKQLTTLLETARAEEEKQRQARLSELKAAADAEQARKDTLQQGQQALNAEIQVVKARQKAASDRVESLEKAIKTIENFSEARRLQQFVALRNQSQDYHAHQGLIATAQQDFQRLSDLLMAIRKERESPETGSGDPLRAIAEETRIDRIVLYIDDLDRCPEDKVVQVLQAVHLLLAFELFVVVVAVDSRWLLHSLQQHLSVFRSQETGIDGFLSGDERVHWQSTPMNYLEKIFQVPFNLLPMGQRGYRRLILELTKSSEGDADRPTDPSQPVPEPPPRDTIPGDAPASVLRASASEPASQPGPNGSGAVAGKEKPGRARLTLRPELLEITREEAETLVRLQPMVPSPRAAKRLVNVYRLLRARLPVEALPGFVGTGQEPGTHRPALLLLAMLVGYPTEATDLLRELGIRRTPDNPPWWNFVESTILREMWEVARGPRNGVAEEAPPEDSDIQSPVTLDKKIVLTRWRRLREALWKAKDLIPDHWTTSRFAEWSSEVARYSFESGRLLGTERPRTLG